MNISNDKYFILYNSSRAVATSLVLYLAYVAIRKQDELIKKSFRLRCLFSSKVFHGVAVFVAEVLCFVVITALHGLICSSNLKKPKGNKMKQNFLSLVHSPPKVYTNRPVFLQCVSGSTRLRLVRVGRSPTPH